MQAKGYVTFAGDKKFGNKTLYSFRIGSEDKWFRTGTTAHGLNKGDLVEFSYNQEGGSNNVDVGSISRVDLNSTSGAQATSATALVNDREKYWTDKAATDVLKERKIQFQAARNASISVVDILLREKLLKLAEGAKADNVSVVLGKIEDLTNEFFEKVQNIKEDTKNDNGQDGSTDTWNTDAGRIPY